MMENNNFGSICSGSRFPAGLIRLLRILICVLASWNTVTQAVEQPAESMSELLARAEVLISLGENEKAYRFMAPYEKQAAGNINFNYLFGLAALDSGHLSEAVFSLQRAVAQDPDYSAARIELARAYYEAEDYAAAEREFKILEKQSPPRRAEVAINNYLLSIKGKSARYKEGLGLYFKTGTGYNSNANGATDVDQFLNFNLSEQSKAQSSSYIDLSYGGNYHVPVNPWYQAVMGVGVNHRRFPSAHFVDLDRVRGNIGFKFDDEYRQLTALLVGGYSQLDGDFNNDDVGIELGLKSRLRSQYWSLLANLRVGRVEYDDPISVQDVDQVIASLGYEWAEQRGKYQRLGGVLILGAESARESNSPYGRILTGFRMFGSRQLNPQLWLLGQGGFQFSDYDGRFFGDQRQDLLIQAYGGLAWRPFDDARWSVQPHLAYYKNHSDIDIFGYDRAEVGVSLVWSTE